jgi:hypothetical protein
VPDLNTAGYAELLAQAKAPIQAARTRAALAVNAELVGPYWRLSRLIRDRQCEASWGAKVEVAGLHLADPPPDARKSLPGEADLVGPVAAAIDDRGDDEE